MMNLLFTGLFYAGFPTDKVDSLWKLILLIVFCVISVKVWFFVYDYYKESHFNDVKKYGQVHYEDEQKDVPPPPAPPVPDGVQLSNYESPKDDMQG